MSKIDRLLTVSVPPDLKKRLRQRYEERRVRSFSRFIALALDTYLKKTEKK